jgi:hypothetical protein
MSAKTVAKLVNLAAGAIGAGGTIGEGVCTATATGFNYKADQYNLDAEQLKQLRQQLEAAMQRAFDLVKQIFAAIEADVDFVTQYITQQADVSNNLAKQMPKMA